MGYSNPLHTITYVYPSVNFATGSTSSFRGPAGLEGRIRSIAVVVGTTFTAVTTPGRVQVGVSGTATANANVSMGTTAAGNTLIVTPQSSASGVIAAPDLGADTNQLVTFVAPTGGTPAGAGTVHITVDWF